MWKYESNSIIINQIHAWLVLWTKREEQNFIDACDWYGSMSMAIPEISEVHGRKQLALEILKQFENDFGGL